MAAPASGDAAAAKPDAASRGSHLRAGARRLARRLVLGAMSHRACGPQGIGWYTPTLTGLARARAPGEAVGRPHDACDRRRQRVRLRGTRRRDPGGSQLRWSRDPAGRGCDRRPYPAPGVHRFGGRTRRPPVPRSRMSARHGARREGWLPRPAARARVLRHPADHPLAPWVQRHLVPQPLGTLRQVVRFRNGGHSSLPKTFIRCLRARDMSRPDPIEPQIGSAGLDLAHDRHRPRRDGDDAGGTVADAARGRLRHGARGALTTAPACGPSGTGPRRGSRC